MDFGFLKKFNSLQRLGQGRDNTYGVSFIPNLNVMGNYSLFNIRNGIFQGPSLVCEGERGVGMKTA